MGSELLIYLFINQSRYLVSGFFYALNEIQALVRFLPNLAMVASSLDLVIMASKIVKKDSHFPITITQDRQNDVKVNFMQMDRLGSTTQILDEDGVVLHTKGFDAFGKPRKGDWSDYGLFESGLDFTNVDENGDLVSSIDISKRGFTNHEHLDEMQLIHMNGRMYDYNNGRFLSVDPFIQAPTSTQSMNPYTYIFNNPLSGTDPSGYTSNTDPKLPEDNVTVNNVERFTPTGSHIKNGLKISMISCPKHL